MSNIPSVSFLGFPVLTENNWYQSPIVLGDRKCYEALKRTFYPGCRPTSFVFSGLEVIFIHSSAASCEQHLINFVVAHEEGHLVNQHQFVTPITKPEELEVYTSMELQADRYALSVSGRKGGLAQIGSLTRDIERRASIPIDDMKLDVQVKRLHQLYRLI